MKFFLKTVLFLLLFFLSSVTLIQAANLTGAKDTITTSRPSAASPLNGDHASGLGVVTIYDNGSRFLASDSAKIVNTPTNGFVETALNVASQSAARTKVYLTNSLTGARSGSDVLTVPITAKHTVQFAPSTYIPASGALEIIFPVGNTTNAASPSASGFSFNALATGNISISGAACSVSWTITPASGLVKCSQITSAVTAGTTVTVTIGSSTPALINPTKGAAAGTADTWSVSINTYDNGGIGLDSTKIKIGTIESVEVRATVEPTLTFTIAGLATGTVISTNNTACGSGGSQAINTGIASTTTVADLGTVSNAQVNVTAQDLTISTNLSGGYVLTATSSGQLDNPSTGYNIANAQGAVTNNNLPVPAAITAATEAFGIHACGTDVATGTWGTRASAATVYYANPSAIYYYTLASRISAASSIKTTVVYGATVSGTTPPGLYLTELTYVATPIF